MVNTKNIGAVADLVSVGVGAPRQGSSAAQARVVPISAMKEDGEFDATALTECDVDDKSERLRLRAGDVLLTARGEAFRAGAVDEHVQGTFPSSNLILIRPGRGLDGAFLAAWLNTPTGRDALRELATGTTVRALTVRAVQSLEIPVPSVETQRRVAEAWYATRRAHTAALRSAELRRHHGYAAIEAALTLDVGLARGGSL